MLTTASRNTAGFETNSSEILQLAIASLQRAISDLAKCELCSHTCFLAKNGVSEHVCDITTIVVYLQTTLRQVGRNLLTPNRN